MDYSRPVRVPCIDLSAWIIRNTSVDDQIVIKMDIEGGEYQVLPKMIDDGALERVSVLYCEWHRDRFPDITQKQHDDLVLKVSSITKLEAWL